MSSHEGIWTEYRPTYADHWSACKRMGDLVRCRDCKQFAVDQSMHEFREQYWCGWWHTDMVEPNSYCAWGERRDA